MFKETGLVFFLSVVLLVNVSGQKTYNVRDYGALGNGKDLDTKALQKAVDVCHADSGGVVFFPPGVYVSGTLKLKSHVTLNIGSGAILQGSRNLSDYELQPEESYTRMTASRHVFIHCVGMNDVSVIGKGTIDGCRLEDPGIVAHGRGPLAVLFENSKDICVNEITIKNAAGWSLTFFGCNDVVARDVKVLNGRADGINPVSSSNVLFDACMIDGSGDDPITIKNEGNPACGHVVENIIIRNCIVRNTTHPAVKIGTGTAGIFRNIILTGCVFENTGDVFSIQLMRPSLKTNSERVIENVTVTNIITKNVRSLIDITTIGVDSPVIRNLYFNNIVVDGIRRSSRILGTREAPIRDIFLCNVSCRSVSGEMDFWLKTDNIDGLAMKDIDLRFNKNINSILEFKNGSKIRVENIEIFGMREGLPLYQLYQAKNVRIRTAQIKPCSPEVSINGNLSEDVSLFSDNPYQSQPVIVSNEVKYGQINPGVNHAEILEIIQPVPFRAGESGTIRLKVYNKGASGMYKLMAYEDGREVGSAWLWLGQEETKNVGLELNPFYRPGEHEIKVEGTQKSLEVLSTPSRIIVNDTLKISIDSESRVRVTLTIRNTGGEAGSKKFSLMQNENVVDEKKVEIKGGETKRVDFQGGVIDEKPFNLKMEGFPEWNFHMASTVGSDFYFTREGHVIIDAGGRLGVNEDYGAVYLNNIKGDFDAEVKFGSLEATGEYAAIGLVVRNELTDTLSNGFMVCTYTLKYGGAHYWRKDMDEDGKFDHCSFEGGKNWIRLCKRGKSFSLYTSNDGENWSKAENEYTISSAGSVQDVGIFGNAYNNTARNRVSFDYFKLTRLGN